MYLTLKLVHLAGVVLFLGNITVEIFWKQFADKTRNAIVMATTMDGINAADRVFTFPGVAILLIGGIGAALAGGIPMLSTGWLLWGIIFVILAGAASVPLSRTQRQLSAAAHAGNMEQYAQLSKGWVLWGSLGLLFPVLAFIVMILKPALPAF